MRWVLFLLAWTGLSLMFVPEVYLFFLYRSEPIPWTHTIALALANAAIAFMFLPPIIWLTRAVPLESRSLGKALAVHVPACLAFSLGHSGLYAVLCYASPTLFHALFLRFHPNVLTYWAIVGFTQAIDYFDRYTDRERRLAQAELLLTKAQLQPHFLFNTLHTISAMMHEDVRGAEQMIVRLSDLLRGVFENVGAHEAPLATELEFVRNYVGIQNVRHGGQLALQVDAAADVMDALVPNMLLQPLVENSIRHGTAATGVSSLQITITVRRDGERLAVTVSDNGAGHNQRRITEGVGLTTTRARLRELYHDRATITYGSDSPSGFRVHFVLPFRRGSTAGNGTWLGIYDDTHRAGGRRAVGEAEAAGAARRRA